MAQRSTKRASLKDFLQAVKQVDGAQALPTGLSFVFGTSEFLVGEAVRRLRRAACGAAVTSLEASSIAESSLSSLLGQASLFEPAALYLIRRTESAKALGKVLKSLPKVKDTSNHICFIYAGDPPTTGIRSELARLGARNFPCHQPWPNETTQALTFMADIAGVKLARDALSLLLEANGDDLVKQNNEIQKLALAFTGKTSSPLTAADIAQHLGMLREDDAFQLDKLLLHRQWSKAQALTGALLARGEKSIALLAILATHCRTIIRLASAQGRSFETLARDVRLPPFILKTYLQALQQPLSISPYLQALTLCQEADLLLKSSRLPEELVLGRIIDVIAESYAAKKVCVR